MLVFYIPLVVQWVGLSLRYGSISLPTLANPNVEFSGLWGGSKSRCMDMIGEDQRHWLADYTTLRRGHGAAVREAGAARVVKVAGDAGLNVPLVAKPDIGWRGFGVRLAGSEAELADYVRAYPEDETIVLQRLIDFESEAGVLYARLSAETMETIISVTFRYFPHVTGDGENSIRKLVLGDQRASWKAGYHFGFEPVHACAAISDLDRVPAEGETVRLSFIGSNRGGGLYRDAREHIAPELTALFHSVSLSMPDFCYGRFDLRFASVVGLRLGEGFKIIEINGAGGESINIWDPDMPISEPYRELFAQQGLLFKIGAMNLAPGLSPFRRHQPSLCPIFSMPNGSSIA